MFIRLSELWSGRCEIALRATWVPGVWKPVSPPRAIHNCHCFGAFPLLAFPESLQFPSSLCLFIARGAPAKEHWVCRCNPNSHAAPSPVGSRARSSSTGASSAGTSPTVCPLPRSACPSTRDARLLTHLAVALAPLPPRWSQVGLVRSEPADSRYALVRVRSLSADPCFGRMGLLGNTGFLQLGRGSAVPHRSVFLR